MKILDKVKCDQCYEGDLVTDFTHVFKIEMVPCAVPSQGVSPTMRCVGLFCGEFQNGKRQCALGNQFIDYFGTTFVYLGRSLNNIKSAYGDGLET